MIDKTEPSATADTALTKSHAQAVEERRAAKARKKRPAKKPGAAAAPVAKAPAGDASHAAALAANRLRKGKKQVVSNLPKPNATNYEATSGEPEKPAEARTQAANKTGAARYANALHPLVTALVEQRFRFETEKQAIDKMESIKNDYTISRQQEENPPKPCVILWIKDFQVTKDEEGKGYMGNYAFVTTEKMLDGLYTLTAVKLDTELKYHPRRKRQAMPVPNWGHPILRNAKKGKIYRSITAIQDELLQLHLEFPDSTIPGDNKLFLMIYSRGEGTTNPVQKYVMKIEPAKGDVPGFILTCEPNNYKPPEQPQKKTEISEDAPQGYFTSLLAAKRKR